MSILPKIDMAEITRLTRAGRLAEATALLRGRSTKGDKSSHLRTAEPDASRPEAKRQGSSLFLAKSFTNGVGTREYKLFVPSGAEAGTMLPLVVMLHGCTQTPDDFAAGTRMNDLAEEQNVFVAYPAQSQAANSSRCWNWFNAADQVRERGEPSIVAGLTRAIMQAYAIDPRRVFVAGLSAGGAAAATLASLYPDLYAAVCVHSGLACGAARDMMSAFSAMQNGGAPRASAALSSVPVPTIVFHGDRDTTVNAANGDQVIAQARGTADYETEVVHGHSPQGSTFTRTIETDRSGRVMLEQWVLHGSGHAWSGGSAAGTFTDPHGVDASAEMLRFFREHPKRP